MIQKVLFVALVSIPVFMSATKKIIVPKELYEACIINKKITNQDAELVFVYPSSPKKMFGCALKPECLCAKTIKKNWFSPMKVLFTNNFIYLTSMHNKQARVDPTELLLAMAIMHQNKNWLDGYRDNSYSFFTNPFSKE